METKLLNPFALDANGKFISIEHAQKGQNYTCPKCGEPLSYCKSGTGPHSRRNHFKHKADTDCAGYYTPHETESYIHKTAKEGICRILLSCLETGQPFPFVWKCPTCGQQYNGDLLRGASDVKKENEVDIVEKAQKARTDVAILNEQGDEIVAIEVVYKHEPEQRTLNLYKEKSITVVRLNFYSVEDLNDLDHKLHNPDSVSLCINVKCNYCQTSDLPRHIIPLQNQEGKYAAVAVAISNPFDAKQQSIWGLPFSEQDLQNAFDFVRRSWPDTKIDLEPTTEQSGKHLARFVTSEPQVQMPRMLNSHGTGLDKELHERKVKAIRKKYAQKSASSRTTSSKKSFRKRR